MTDDTDERDARPNRTATGRGAQPGGVGGLTIRLETLGVMNRLGERGVSGIADRLRRLDCSDGEVVAERATGGFIPRDGVDAAFGDEDSVGVRVSLSDVPGGYVLVVFGLASANRAATMMLSNTVDDLESASNELAQSAVTELGGMIAYGFVDAFADAVGREVDVRRPLLFTDTERALVERTLDKEEGLGLYIASRFRLPEEDVTTDVYLFPDSEAMIRAVEDAGGVTDP